MSNFKIRNAMLELYKNKTHKKMVSIDPHVRVIRSTETVKDGQFVRESGFVVDCVEDNFKGFNHNDFSIASIQAAGAIQTLKPVSFRNGDVTSIGSQVDAIAKGIDEAISKISES